MHSSRRNNSDARRSVSFREGDWFSQWRSVFVTDMKMDPNSPLNGQGAGHGAAPTIMDMKVPLCETMAPRAPHAIHNGGTVPLHYYQVDFKRIDGAGFVQIGKSGIRG